MSRVRSPWENYQWPGIVEPTREEFLAGRGRKYGRGNPDPVEDPFLEFMIRTRAEPFFLRDKYSWTMEHYFQDAPEKDRTAIWSFRRIGYSMTPVYNEWRVYIGGEHDDSYDPDFLIYNDVIVRGPAGEVWIYAYPRDAFIPTDFHTATLLDESSGYSSSLADGILIIGGLGYERDREFWSTPVHWLSLDDMSIRKLETTGDLPGWIHMHQTHECGYNQLMITGGKVLTPEGDFVNNTGKYVLDLLKLRWTKLPEADE